MQLNKFQGAFKNLMLDHPDALDRPPAAITEACEEGDIPLPARLKVYRNNIIGSLTDVMVATFPLIDNLVGREFLEVMARSFILKNPPSQGCLSLYGEGFAEFIEGFPSAAELPYLPDVARYELALNKSYYAADDTPLTVEAFSSVAPEDLGDLQITLRDSVYLLASQYPLIRIEKFCSEGGEGVLDVTQGGENIMVFRPALETQTAAIAEDELKMMQNFQNKATLGAAVEAVLQAHPDFDFQSFLQKHLTLETFQAFETNRK